MTTIAIAGGAGNIGRTIADAVGVDIRFKAIVLGRKKSVAAEKPDKNIVAVNYGDIEALAAVLKSNEVHTLISALSLMSPEAGVAEVNLVKAAARSGVQRFIASEWGVPTPHGSTRLTPQHSYRLATEAELCKTSLEWTRIYNGHILDYFGIPHIETYMPRFTFAVDMPNKAAAIPGTGNEAMTFTTSKDLARFVVAALSLPQWNRALYCYGEKTTWNKFLEVAEEMTASKFVVKYNSISSLERDQNTELPSHAQTGYEYFPKPILQHVLSTIGLYVVAGAYDLPEEGSLNVLFPDIKTTTVRDMLSVWKGK